MIRRVWLLGAFAFASISASAEAKRVVDYNEAKASWQAWEAEQGIDPVSVPAPRDGVVDLTFAPGVDHQVVRGGIGCSAWTVDNPVSQLIRDMVADWSGSGVIKRSASSISLRVERASTFSRCVQTGEMKTTCVTRVTLDATVANGTTSVPVQAEVELPTRAIGACAGLTRGIAVISRAAVAQLLTKVRATDPADSGQFTPSKPRLSGKALSPAGRGNRSDRPRPVATRRTRSPSA